MLGPYTTSREGAPTTNSDAVPRLQFAGRMGCSYVSDKRGARLGKSTCLPFRARSCPAHSSTIGVPSRELT